MTTTEGRVTTVVVSRNRRDQLLNSLGHHQAPVILVDNGSDDGTLEDVPEQFPDVRVVPLGRNHGSPGRNVGVRQATTPYVAFADDDSWWAPGSLSRCADLMDAHPRLGLVAARMLVGPEERLDPLCEVMARSPLPAAPAAPAAAGTPILGFMACGAVVRREAYLRAGGFDPVTFFMGEEDRLAWDMAADGWELVYRPDVVAHHHPQPSRHRNGKSRMVTRNAVLTAVMRRPWPVALREVASACGNGRQGLGALVDALPRLRAALACRSTLPADVEARIRMLQG